MEKVYTFIFPGTREALVERLNLYHHDTAFSGAEYYYLGDYIVKIENGAFRFGVERGGHSRGYWFIPSATEEEGQLVFRGSIQHIGPKGKIGKFRKVIDGIELALLVLLLLPLVLLIRLCLFVRRSIKKLPKEKTTEEKMYDLMENHLGCIRKSETVKKY